MKENQRIAVTKRMLKEGLLRLLEEKPLEKIRVSELCEESGINRATFYRHYEAPKNVLLELEMDFTRQLIPRPGKYPKTAEETQQALEDICTYIYNNAAVAEVLFRCNTEEDIVQGINEFCRYYWDLRKTEKDFRDVDEDTARMVTALLGGGIYCLLRQWIMEKIPKTPAEIAAIMYNAIRWPTPEDFRL